MKVKVGVSNRHVHLTKDTYEYLFDGKMMEKRNELSQAGEFASTDTVDLEYDGKTIYHVRVVGPFRSHDQIELLGSDINYLELHAPVRRSGDLENTPSIKIKNGDKVVETDGVIRAERHVHVNTDDQERLGLFERDKVHLVTRKGEVEAFVKISKNARLELHIDKDEAEEYGLSTGDEVEIRKI